MSLNLSLDKYDWKWESLEKVLVADGDFEVGFIKKAFDYATRAHEGQLRESGDNYMCHPVWIARVAAQMHLGNEAVAAALLHDCVEDTSVTINDIAHEFGDEVALLVNGLTEVKKKTKDIEVHKTSISVFRHFLFSSVDDVRVLILRLIDKLHNGLTINYLSRERQEKYANRIFGIYGPTAEYVGLHYFKRLLDDIAFKILYPIEAEEIEKELGERKNDEIRALNLIKIDLEKTLKVNGIVGYEIEGRIKSIYGTYIKSKKYGKSKTKDRVGLRVITNSVPDCYTVLGLIHMKYAYIETEFKDYISSPKPNGYRSIQTTFNWKNGITVEVQIRTREMHDFNEFGPASHIAYKMRVHGSAGRGYEWVKDLVKWQKNDKNVNNYRIQVLQKYVYVFTPKGDTVQLPTGSTALDYAYKIHSELGDHCSVVKINSKVGKISDILKTGDMVEIISSKRVNVSKNWLDFVKTTNAKERIKKLTTIDNN